MDGCMGACLGHRKWVGVGELNSYVAVCYQVMMGIEECVRAPKICMGTLVHKNTT